MHSLFSDPPRVFFATIADASSVGDVSMGSGTSSWLNRRKNGSRQGSHSTSES